MRKANKSKKLSVVRQRVQQANAAATEDRKLCNRTSSALDFLLNYKQLAFILEALINLGEFGSCFSAISSAPHTYCQITYFVMLRIKE